MEMFNMDNARRYRRRAVGRFVFRAIRSFKRGHKGDVMCVTKANRNAAVGRYDS